MDKIENYINDIEAYVKKIEEDNKVLLEALLIGAQYARNNLPAELPYNDDNFETYVQLFAGGNKRDPEGKEFANLWLYLAKKKIFDFIKKI